MDGDPWRNPFAEPEPEAASTLSDLKRASSTPDWDATLPVIDLRTSHSSFEPPSWEPPSVPVDDDGGWTSSAFMETPAWDGSPKELSWRVNADADFQPRISVNNSQVTLSVHNLDRPDWKSESLEYHDTAHDLSVDQSTPVSQATTHHVPSFHQTPDTFGGFESGSCEETDTEDPWHAGAEFADNAWSSAGVADAQSSHGEEQEPVKDEWDIVLEAQKQKESVVVSTYGVMCVSGPHGLPDEGTTRRMGCWHGGCPVRIVAFLRQSTSW